MSGYSNVSTRADAWAEPDSLVRRIFIVITVIVLLLAIYSSIWLPAFERWGATDEELDRVLPGDHIITRAGRVSTRALTINAPVSAVWPWIVQMGQERGGLYSYEALENLIGCDIHNADRIVPEWQNPQPGDRVSLGPEGYPFFTIAEVDPEHAFVLRAGDGSFPSSSWVFVVEPIDETTTRLIVRMRSTASETRSEVFWNDCITPPLHFLMEREMLYGIARRAEALVS